MENREEVKVETKKKGNGLFTLFACVMTGVIVFLAMNVGKKAGKVVDPEVNTNKESNITSNVESNSNVTSNVESNSNVTSNVTTNTVTDAEKAAINEKLSLLFSGNKIENNIIRAGALSELWSPLFKGNANEVDIQGIVFLSIERKEFKKYAYKSVKISKEYKDILDAKEALEGIPASKLAELYKKLTGKAMTKYVDLPLGCPVFAYDSANKAYVEIPGCGGAELTGDIIYLDSYTKSNNNIVVTAYVAGIKGTSGDAVVYTDYTDSSLETQKAKEYKSGVNYETFKIDETNKTSFAKYNINFAKASDGQYYFSSVTKAN